MKKIALIPARYAATRFPGKLMAPLAGKTVIWRTYEAVRSTGVFDEVMVVTDSDVIYNEIIQQGGKAVMSKREHESGSDRIAEAVETMEDVDIVVNVQGDTPFTQREPLEKLMKVFEGEEGKKVQVASLMQEMTDWNDIEDPNFVKVAVDKDFNALFFSRSVIPYPRDTSAGPTYYEHIGIYAFRRNALLQFTKTPVSMLEAAEKIECLRYLENGIPMKMVVTEYMGVEIDTPEDLDRASKLLENN